MTRREALLFGKESLEKGSIPDAAWDAEVLFEYVTGCDRTARLLEGGKELEDELWQQYVQLIEKRRKHIPLQYLTGEQFFMGFPFRVSPDVLIPRLDTEILVLQVLEHLKKMESEGILCEKGPKILDMCTGSGCIAISLERLWNGENGHCADVEAVDVSAEALQIARGNGEKNAARVNFCQSDLFSEISGNYDIIVSNPPYIASREVDRLMDEVRLYEPRLALDGQEDGLFFYKRIVKEAPHFLKKGGWLFLEIGCDQGETVPVLMEEAGFEQIEIKKDLAGLDRVVYGRICHV